MESCAETKHSGMSVVIARQALRRSHPEALDFSCVAHAYSVEVFPGSISGFSATCAMLMAV